MVMRDYEVLEADLFELTGLGGAPEEDRIAFIQEFTRLLGLTGIILTSERLSEKDQDTYGRLLQGEETERAMAFLVSRDIDIDDITTEEAIRIKRAVIESGRQMESVFDLLLAVKAQLPATVLMADVAELNSALNEVQEYAETLPVSEEQKAWTADHIAESAERNVMNYIGDFVPSDDIERVGRLMDEDKMGEALQLMLSHGFDYAHAMTEELRSKLSSFKEEVRSLLIDVPTGTEEH
jgi:predicted oxidoreductase